MGLCLRLKDFFSITTTYSFFLFSVRKGGGAFLTFYVLKNSVSLPPLPPKSQEILPFLIICALILHPVAELGHAANLLAVIIGDRVGVGLAGRVDSVLLDAAVEIFVFLRKTLN